MRTIKFRGKKITNDVWVYGSFVCSADIATAIYYQKGNGSVKSMDWVYVKPETIGQFTGLYDRSSKEIYEGDVVSIETIKSRIAKVVEWNDEKACWDAGGDNRIELYAFRHCEVIGNIHDNPELLKGKE